MTDRLLHARLFNQCGELIAEGPCWVDETEGRATLEPQYEPGFIQKERGELSLKLDSGRSLAVSDRPMIVKLGASLNGDTTNGHRSLYRLRLLESGTEAGTNAHEANAAGAVAEGSTTPPQVGLRSNGETPVAR